MTKMTKKELQNAYNAAKVGDLVGNKRHFLIKADNAAFIKGGEIYVGDGYRPLGLILDFPNQVQAAKERLENIKSGLFPDFITPKGYKVWLGGDYNLASSGLFGVQTPMGGGVVKLISPYSSHPFFFGVANSVVLKVSGDINPFREEVAATGHIFPNGGSVMKPGYEPFKRFLCSYFASYDFGDSWEQKKLGCQTHID